MKINQIVNEMTAGCVASVAMPLGKTQKRADETTNVQGLTNAQNVISKKAKKKGPYANSLIAEGKMKDLSMDLRAGKDGLSDEEFKKKYGKTKEEMRKALKSKPVQEAKLDEDDLILIPGQGGKRKTGLVPHGESRVDHEVEMARSDVLATMKNAKAIYELLKHRSEEEGLEGWVQEKLIKANDYLNAVKEYYDEKVMQQEMTGGVIAGGGVGEGKFTINAKTGAKLDPRTGVELPPKEKPLTMKQMFAQPKQPKLTLDDVWRKVEDVVGQIFPDGDPIDHLAPWLEKHGIRDFKIGEILDRAAKKNGYKDLYDYYDSMKDQYAKDNVAEGLAKGQAEWKKEMIAKGAVRFWRDRHGDGAVDRIIAYDKNGEVVGGFNRKGVAEGSEDPSYKKGWKLCDKDPSADPQHLFRKHGEGLDRNQFIKGFNDNAKLRGMSIYGDVSGDVDHSTLRYKEFKRDQGVAEGSIKDAEQALARHGQYKVDYEKKYGPMSGADLHQHEVMRKQLLDKKRRAQSAYAKKQGVAEGYNLDSHIKQTRDRILKYKDWNTTGSHDKKIKELQDKLKELLAQKKQGVTEAGPKGYDSFGNPLGGGYDEYIGDPHGHKEAERNRQQNLGPFYLKVNGKILRTGGEVKVFDYKNGAKNYALAILKRKPELQGKIFITNSPKDDEQGVSEGAKVDRMVQHIKKSEIESGKSADKAEDIAWATVNKRGYLDNKNKKSHK